MPDISSKAVDLTEPRRDTGRDAIGITSTGYAPANGIRIGLLLSFITGLQILTAFGVQWITVTQLGFGLETDALFAGMTFPQMIGNIVVSCLTSVLIPILSSMSERQRRLHVWPLFLGIGLLFSCIFLALFSATPLLVQLLVPGFSDATKQITIDLTRIQLLGVVGASCYAVLLSLYQARNRFVWAALSTLFFSGAGFLILLWKLPEFGVTLAAWVHVLTVSGPVVLLLPGLGRIDRSAWQHDHRELVRVLWHRITPILWGASYYQTAFVLERFLASFLAPGSVVILDLSHRIHSATERILYQGIVTPVVPTLSRLAEKRHWKDFRALCRQRLFWMLVLSSITLMVFFAVTVWGQELVYSRPFSRLAGRLTSEDITKIWTVFMYMSGALLFSGARYMLIRAYYALGNTRKPTKIDVVAYTVALILEVIGFFIAGILGIALAISSYYLISWILLMISHNRRNSYTLREESSDRGGKLFSTPRTVIPKR